MEKDEKLCPMCGETIKLIAIKCKHCHSIMSDQKKDDVAEDFYYYRYGSSKEEGPFTYEEIKDMYENEKISSSVFISKNDTNDWDVITSYLLHQGNEKIKDLNNKVSSNKNWLFLIMAIIISSAIVKIVFFSAAEKDLNKIINEYRSTN